MILLVNLKIFTYSIIFSKTVFWEESFKLSGTEKTANTEVTMFIE